MINCVDSMKCIDSNVTAWNNDVNGKGHRVNSSITPKGGQIECASIVNFNARDEIIRQWEESDKEHFRRVSWDEMELDAEGKENAKRFQKQLKDMALPVMKGGRRAFQFYADGIEVTMLGGYVVKENWAPKFNYCPMCGRKLN